MYDRQTESLWLQVKREAVTGPLTGTKLKKLPSTVTSWKKWRKRHPQTAVLSPVTGHSRDYENDPYTEYYKSRSGFFSFLKPAPGTEEKTLVVGIEIDGATAAYPLNSLRHKGEITDLVGGKSITISFDPGTDMVRVSGDEGETFEHLLTYWMVWKGIFPDTTLYGTAP